MSIRSLFFNTCCAAAAIYLNSHQPYLFDERKEKIVQKNFHFDKFGFPIDCSNLSLDKTHWIGAYDASKRNPKWIMHVLDHEQVNSKVMNEKKHSKQRRSFVRDKAVCAMFQTNGKEFLNSGYDRGHIVPALDMKYVSDDAFTSSFTLANISPQIPDFNRNYWKKMEEFVPGTNNFMSN